MSIIAPHWTASKWQAFSPGLEMAPALRARDLEREERETPVSTFCDIVDPPVRPAPDALLVSSHHVQAHPHLHGRGRRSS